MATQLVMIAGAAWICVSLGAIAGMMAAGVMEQKIEKAVSQAIAGRDGLPGRRIGGGSRWVESEDSEQEQA